MQSHNVAAVAKMSHLEAIVEHAAQIEQHMVDLRDTMAENGVYRSTEFLSGGNEKDMGLGLQEEAAAFLKARETLQNRARQVYKDAQKALYLTQREGTGYAPKRTILCFEGEELELT